MGVSEYLANKLVSVVVVTDCYGFSALFGAYVIS